jgi:long-chain acyl-CoA synthetase
MGLQAAIGIGYRQAQLREESKPVPALLALQFWLARAAGAEQRAQADRRAPRQVLVTGAAPISPDLVRWYMALGLDMVEVWGQTESCGAVHLEPGRRIKPARSARDGARRSEGLARGRDPGARRDVFMGYLNQPEKTAETLKDGWLHTGDVGKVDAEGYFYITDRMKDIIITAGGKNITPSEFENQLKFSPYITDAVVIGEKRPYLTSLVMIDHENVENSRRTTRSVLQLRSLCRRPRCRS